ncbi:sensor histidine kinase [Pontibacter beigongshangensis]|uniref:sensor histidine kinase n=1 Tax=Pontibacter beigongshangensis TaxID=2574733 RepID=UPI0016500D12|nr:HAMP domain-containing sensor histidine kinase [Pontibacter beigongshangensis]
MRILTQTSLYYLLVSVVVFLLGSLLFYKHLQTEIYDEVDDQLFTDKENIIQYIREHNRLPNVTSGISEAILVREAQHSSLKLEELGDTLIFSSYDEEYIPFRRLTFTAFQDNKPYEYTILKSLTDFQDLFESTMMAMGWIFLMLLVGLVFVNYFINKFTWRHFYETLHMIKQYSLTRYSPLQLKHSSTTEFQELNTVLQAMTDKIYSDYLNLKEFTENASHEIQTPLAIVSNKLELFMQSDNLTPPQARMLEEMAASVSRLARLNRSLILLTRIENREFQEQEQVPLHLLLQEQLEQLQEMVELMGLRIEMPEELEPVWWVMNRGLAEVLVSNLLLNAIRHNHEGGTISIHLTKSQLRIINTGAALHNSPEELLGRYISSSQVSGSLGIGLALVKKICDLHQIKLTYSYADQQHHLLLTFTQSRPVS